MNKPRKKSTSSVSQNRKKPSSKKRYAKKDRPVSKEKSRSLNKGKNKSKKRSIQKSDRIKKKKQKRLFVELVLTFSISFTLLYLLTILVFSLPKVTGYSMVPTVNDQERLFVYKWGKIKRFDLVYLKNGSGEVSIRRVIGLPGEEIEYRKDELYINNEMKAERFLTTVNKGESDEPLTPDFKLFDLLKTAQVPEKKYFVLGDNREYAADSRFYGFVDEKEIIGVVKARIFPFYDMRQF